MTKRTIRSHKGGRTAIVPSGRIRPQTLERIHETMRKQGKSFADLIEEKFSGGNEMMIATVTNHDDSEGNPFVAVIVKGKTVKTFPYPKDTSTDEGIKAYQNACMDATFYCVQNNYQERDI